MKNMSFVEKVRRGEIKVGDDIWYHPDYGTALIKPEETGMSKQQTFQTEDLYYKFSGFWRGVPMIVSTRTTRQIVAFRGQTGFRKAEETLQRICKECFSSECFGAIGINLEEENNIYDKISENYFLSSQERMYKLNTFYFGVKTFQFGMLRKSILFDTKGNVHTAYGALRPAVLLPLEIQLNEKNELIPFEGKRGFFELLKKPLEGYNKAQLNTLLGRCKDELEKIEKERRDLIRKMEEIEGYINNKTK